MALVELSVVEQRYRAVLAVLAGATVTEVAAQLGVSRQTVSGWKSRYEASGLAGLVDRSRRPASCPHQASAEVEAAVCELRRKHPRWGPRRIAHVLERSGAVSPVPSRMTVYRILVRHGLVEPGVRRRKRSDYKRWQRERAMQLWQMDIVGGVMLVNPVTGELTEAKIVTGVDDHSRYCVIASVVERATGRAVCAAFARALQTFGVPEEVLTDNGKQFTARFGRGGEVMFDRICRENGIAHRLTQPASPTTTGKVERFHQTLRRELLDDCGAFESIQEAQAALDEWVQEYNSDRPHQALDMHSPADRFTPVPEQEREVLGLKIPGVLALVPQQRTAPAAVPDPVEAVPAPAPPPEPVPAVVQVDEGGPVEFERVVPASGNLQVAGKQFWLGPARSGLTVTFWADTSVIHLLIAGTRIKSVRSHLSVVDLAQLAARGGRAAGPPPLPAGDGAAFEVDRVVNNSGLVGLGGHQVLAAEILGGRAVGIRIDEETLSFFDPASRELLRVRPNPLTSEEVRGLRGLRPAGPPPRPRVESVSVQRRISAVGTIMVCRQTVPLGRPYAGQTVTVHVSDTTITVELDGQIRVIRRTTDVPVRNVKANKPHGASHVS
ncbi:IS481 family transposase [Streptomyces caniscabiei]|uniref:IS481 family transposase n=1 Tax=Streptomyces caniscabiei TaxID=2746961 RepID=A0ABU4N3A4_9ACTN|nr:MULTISPECIES: IS481 family transposase [Streptomyces]MBE4742012.1 IS481 family transposase [Streptomyces caniscabiei]MBE4762777.1 IS481 family transposase [Streptomyces caniscabiei]MBE4790830.1 IS481 family transposase [Streptomyces caniscabiei]MBE4800017.1 IS481 family transposase [Streptomyces caniscabiei]MDX2949103.1 IS481 family transposase [Streptomyces caniscabiei]